MLNGKIREIKIIPVNLSICPHSPVLRSFRFRCLCCDKRNFCAVCPAASSHRNDRQCNGQNSFILHTRSSPPIGIRQTKKGFPTGIFFLTFALFTMPTGPLLIEKRSKIRTLEPTADRAHRAQVRSKAFG